MSVAGTKFILINIVLKATMEAVMLMLVLDAICFPLSWIGKHNTDTRYQLGETFFLTTPSTNSQWCTYRVLIERRGANSPLLMVCSLLSYSERRLRFCRSWKVLTLKQLILLAFRSLRCRKVEIASIYLVFTYLAPLSVCTTLTKDNHMCR